MARRTWFTPKPWSREESLIDRAVSAVRGLFYYELLDSKRNNGVKLDHSGLESYISRMQTLMKVRMQEMHQHYEKRLQEEIKRIEAEANAVKPISPYADPKPHHKE
ncbi:hypothetical protein D3C75_447100 [compost metagenome]